MNKSNKITTEEFIKKAKKIHGDKYDYSLVEYLNNRTKVKLIYDNIVYEQIPYAHLKGKCPEKVNIKYTTEEFIKIAKEVHGNKYDYSLVNYNGCTVKIKIIYNGIIYEQISSDHLRGCCPEIHTPISREEFIKKSKEIYGKKYDYSLVTYINSLTKIKLIYKNKIYEQTPRHHLNGRIPIGLFDLNDSNGVTMIKKFLDFFKIDYKKEYSFNDCRNVLPLPFDFYLPEHNILIEFDGEQHFKPIKIWGGEKAFIYRLKLDNIKNLYTKEKGIPLLRISFLEENIIDIILTNFFKSHEILVLSEDQN